jgi:hypothetical protein
MQMKYLKYCASFKFHKSAINAHYAIHRNVCKLNILDIFD